MKTLKYLSLLIISALTIVSCEDLDVENTNDPDFTTAMSNATDVKGVAGGLYNTFYMTTSNYDGPALAMWTMADAGTCSWGNAGMRALSSEPRTAFDNTATYGYASINSNFYSSLYSALSQANDVLTKTVVDGLTIEVTEGTDDTQMVNAMAYFVQGISLGYLGLVYDQSFIVTEYTDLNSNIPLSTPETVIDSALVRLDKCIAICNSNDFTISSSWIPTETSLDQDGLKALASSYAARILAMAPRNASQDEDVDWQAVYDYASAGVTTDFAPVADDVTWYNSYHTYANYSGWGRVDMRIVNMLDPRMPSTWPDNGFSDLPTAATAETEGIDQRLLTNFQYLTSNNFSASRGTYHYSCYRFSGHDTYLTTWTEPMPEFPAAENDLLKAEAAMHLNKLTEAANIINDGSRTSKGGLSEISATESEIADAIFHERMIELFNTSMGLEYFTMRKADLLQEGTMLHFPIPGDQLDVLEMDYYTFGGTTGVAGEDYSNGGWK